MPRPRPMRSPVPAWTAALLLAAALLPMPARAQTSIRSVQPRAVTLEPGARGVQLLIQGEGLDQAREGAVTLSGRAVTDVRVSILKSDPRSLLLELTAQAPWTGRGSLALELITAKARVAVPVTIEVAAPRPGLRSVIAPASLEPGQQAKLQVELDGPAPAQGVVVSLSSSHPDLDVPGTVLVPDGRASAAVTVAAAGDPPQPVTASIEAELDGVIRQAAIELLPPALPPEPVLVSVSLADATLVPGEVSQITVSLDRPAPEVGVTVTVQVDQASSVSVPAVIPILAGASSGSGSVEALEPTSGFATVDAQWDGTTRTAMVTVHAPPAAPTLASAAAFLVTITDPETQSQPAEPTTLVAGAFTVTIVDPESLIEPAEPVTLSAGTFVVTITPPGDS